MCTSWKIQTQVSTHDVNLLCHTVLKAQSIKNGKYVAIKCMKNHFDSLDQVNNLREIQALRRLSPHANIIKLLEVGCMWGWHV